MADHESYDAFISFRGDVACDDFTHNLYKALHNRGIHTSVVDEIYFRNEITQSVVEVIEESRIAIIVFSDDYASSSFCLEILALMVDNFMRNHDNRFIFPVFYNIDPSDVRKQTGPYTIAFANHEHKLGRNSEKVLKWKSALSLIGGLSGTQFNHSDRMNMEGGPGHVVEGGEEERTLMKNDEFDFIDKIVEEVFSKFHPLSCKVFISIRGHDTPTGFASNLCRALTLSRFHTIMPMDAVSVHEEDLPWERAKVIRESRITIVIFSENFVDECEDEELPYIYEHSKMKNPNHQWVYPVFYNTSRSHVETTAYNVRIKRNIDYTDYDLDLYSRWTSAVSKFVDLPGWEFKHGEGNEFEFIGNIVENVSRMFDCVPPIHARIPDVFPDVSQTPQSVFAVMFKPETKWKVVGLLSSVGGLLCYVLSPCFKRIIKLWKPFMVVYVVVCLVILTTILFADQLTLSTRYASIKTYTSFAVLMMISVYSFFYDKAVNGQPNILSAISNALFALMSLSLHKLINLKSEIGMFTYFLGCFTVQLITINWMLIFVAIIYGCLLFVMHSSLNSQPEAEGVELLREHTV